MKAKVLVELELNPEHGGSLGIRTKKEMVEYFASCINGMGFDSIEILYPTRSGSKNERESY